MKVIIRNPLQNKSRKTKKSKTIKNQMNMKGSEDKPCGYIY